MSKSSAKNLHVPLPEPLYFRLRAEAERRGRPATELAREAIHHWLIEQHRRVLYEAIQSYAREAGGTPDDLDLGLETAAYHQFSAEGAPESPES